LGNTCKNIKASLTGGHISPSVYLPSLTSIISGTGAAVWPKKTNFRPTGHHRPRSSPLSSHMHRSQRFCHFLNVSWKSCFVRVFSTACDSASITSVVSKWRPISFIFNRYQFYLQSGKQKSQGEQEMPVGWVEDDSHDGFW
jgi:hypothetical protein